MTIDTASPKVYFITGTSSGFGYHYVSHVLSQGHCVVATTRDISKLPAFPGSDDLTRFLAISLDVTSPDSVNAAFEQALVKFSRIDVVVNNAGFGLASPFETLSNEQIKTQMDVNFFGVVNVTRKAIQVMRESGHGGLIQQCSSIVGHVGVPGFAFYCASKHALEGFTESVAQEMHPDWKIRFTIVCPGGFKTGWYSTQNLVFGTQNLELYKHLDVKEFVEGKGQITPGDPVKAVQKMYELSLLSDPPIRVFLGSDAHAVMERKGLEDATQRKIWEHVTLSTDWDCVDGSQKVIPSLPE